MEWRLLMPELYFLLGIVLLFSLSMRARQDTGRIHRIAYFLAAIGVVVSLAAVGQKGTAFSGVYRVDLFSQAFKVMLALALFLSVCLCRDLNTIRERRHTEFYLLLMIATLGMMLLVSSVELLTLYVSLELTSYSLYVLVPLRRGYGVHVEAGIKYFLVGVTTSALMLFGLALLFGATRSTSLAELAKVMPSLIHSPMAFTGLLLALCGFFFKLAVFPFHVWAPGVYQGAANQVTAFIATASKVAAIGVIARIVSVTGGESIPLAKVLEGVAIASMTLGNLVAIVQKDLKRMLAYSAIAQGGYVLVGILSMSRGGYASAIFYALAYLIMIYTCFLVLVKVAGEGEDLKIVQLAGLHRRSPLLAMALMLGVFGLGGLPPTIGFTGKFLLFTAAMKSGHFFLVLVAMINVAVSLYYYALVVKAAYLLKPERELPPLSLSVSERMLATALILVLVGGGLFPQVLYNLATAAAKVLP
ncbi:MAG: NADH-quinone oxidoreductase subunit N [Desulfatiglandaceae bacterium]|jgi:NADH-quinone oxidoreductase subunit N